VTYNGMSLAIRAVAVLDVMLMIACIVVGMHDMEIPQEGFLANSLLYWTFPSCGVLIVACLYRLAAKKQRVRGGVRGDFVITAIPVLMFVGFMISNAGH
jgi:hypothetical protein